MRILLLTAALLLAPLASAHGAPEAREIDERVLADGSTNGDYGASGSLDEGGLDVLALDVHEATLDGAPALVFRVIVQGGDAAASHTLTFTFAAGGDRVYTMQSDDLATWTSSDFAAIRGPFDVGDGHPKAIEGIVPLSALGVSQGDEVAGIHVTSSMDGDDADVMPGSWYLSGVEVPTVEDPPAPGNYALRGLPSWFTITADTTSIEPGQNVTVDLTSNLDAIEQFVTLTVQAPAGMEATLDGNAILAPGEAVSKTLTLTGFGVGDVRIIAQSDLGLERELILPLASAPIVGDGGDVESALLTNGQTFLYRFTTPATFEYHCHPHPSMTGEVVITEDDPTNAPQVHVVRIVEGDAADVLSYAFTPQDLTIEANDTVLWVNEGDAEHNIMGTTGLSGGGHDHGHDHGAHGHGDEDSVEEEAPGPGLGLLLGAVALVALLRRR